MQLLMTDAGYEVEYLPKPIDSDELLDVVADAMAQVAHANTDLQ